MCSLPRKADAVFSLPFHIFALSEVRVSHSGIHSLTRLAASHSLEAVWSSPPPPSPTFSVAPGGTAVFVRKPLKVRSLTIPALERWRLRARMCACEIVDTSGASAVVISAYGIPPGHVERKTNEDFVRDLLVALLSLKCPAFLCGDLNDTVKESQSLSLASALGVFHLNPGGASTKRRRESSWKEAIDHVFANKAAIDMDPMAVFEPGIDLSDHTPLRLSFKMLLPDFDVVKWPSIPRNIPKQVCTRIPWVADPSSFQEWQEAATQWLRESTGSHIPDKSRWAVCRFKSPSPHPEQQFCRLMRISRAVSEITRFGSNQLRANALRRKVIAMKKKRWVDLLDHPALLATHSNFAKTWEDKFLGIPFLAPIEI